jgi:membrane protease YdiL (CAAX protease family)
MIRERLFREKDETMDTGLFEHCGNELQVAPVSERPAPKVSVKEVVPWLFALAVTMGELFVTLFNVRTGMVIHVFLLGTMLVWASVIWYQESRGDDETAGEILIQGTPGYRFYIALSLAPIIRIISLAIPMWNFPVMYWYLITGAPLLLTSFVIIRLVGYRYEEVCLRWGRPWEQAGVALAGVPLGWIEYQILRPTALVPGNNIKMLILAGFILLVFTGLVEEVIFRGIMLKAADDYLGKTPSLIYSGLIFAVLHIIHYSFLDVVFVFGVAMLFIFFVRRTGSILGVTLAHGITNIMLYLVWPLIFLH